MANDTLKIDIAVDGTRPWSARPIAADGLAGGRYRVVGRDRFAAAIDRFEKAIAARDVPVLARGIA
jgi:hypothetical protein